MKRVERINTIMRYINNRGHFTITEIMNEFAISRSTAIRDIQEIEQMGVPLVAEVGRTGGYSVVANTFLPSIRFTDNEIKALFIAFMATRNQQLPYLKSRQSLAEKLLGLLSEAQQDSLVTLNQLLLFEGTNPQNPDLLDLSDLPHPMLEHLIQLVLIEPYVTLTVPNKKYSLYLVHLYREKSRWFLQGLDLTSKEMLTLPIDYLLSIDTYTGKKIAWPQLQKQQVKQPDNVLVTLGLQAIQQFKKYHPFKYSLAYTNPFQTTAKLSFYLDETDEEAMEEIANWLFFLGADLQLVTLPDPLKKRLAHKAKGYDFCHTPLLKTE